MPSKLESYLCWKLILILSFNIWCGFQFVFREPISMMLVLFLKWYKTVLWQCYPEEATYLFFNRVCLLKFQIQSLFSFLKDMLVLSQCFNLPLPNYTLIWTPSKSSLPHFSFINYTFPSIIHMVTASVTSLAVLRQVRGEPGLQWCSHEKNRSSVVNS